MSELASEPSELNAGRPAAVSQTTTVLVDRDLWSHLYPVDEAVIQQYARITAECRAAGQALHDRRHIGDRWIAATAAAWDLALLAGDQIYVGGPGLRLFGEAGQ